MKKKNKDLDNNIVKFPKKLNDGEREIEAIIFAALEPLDVDTIETKISKKVNVLKVYCFKRQKSYINSHFSVVLMSQIKFY